MRRETWRKYEIFLSYQYIRMGKDNGVAFSLLYLIVFFAATARKAAVERAIATQCSGCCEVQY